MRPRPSRNVAYALTIIFLGTLPIAAQVTENLSPEVLWLDGSHHSVDTGKRKPNQQINAQRPENGFRIGLLLGEDAAEDNHHDKYIEHKTKNDVEDGKDTGVGPRKQHTFQQGGNGKQQSQEQEGAPQADCVHRDQNYGATEHTECEISEAAALHIRVEDERRQQEEKKQKKLVSGQSLDVR
jgi:hypothetical protein